METNQVSNGVLNMFTHPVFQVKDGTILAVNHSAQTLQINENTSVFDMITSGAEEYQGFDGGTLSLTLKIGQAKLIATVVRTGGSDYFHLIAGNNAPDLQALALASQHLRDPLSNVIALSDSLFALEQNNMDLKKRARYAQLNQNLHRLLRSVGNMSDVQSCTERKISMEPLNIADILRQATETVQQQLDSSDVLKLAVHGIADAGMADRDLLERAAFNLLSNALRYKDENTQVHATIRCEKKRVVFTVENSCKDLTPEKLETIFFRYRNTPSITDSNKGLGLGIPMVQAAASVHNGSLLVTQPAQGKVRFCLTIPIMQDKSGNLRSPIIRPDYAGGFDRCLIELSDILPASAYEK